MRFTPGELECMQVLWDHGELKPSEIQDLLPRALNNSALRSYLTILVQKGHVTRRKVGKAYYYQARSPRDNAFRGMVQELASVFFEGSTKRLAAHLAQSENLSPDEIEELRRVAGEADGEEERA